MQVQTRASVLKSSIARAGADIASPRDAARRGQVAGSSSPIASDTKAPYRKQREWQVFVDQLVLDHGRIRDDLQRELYQMQESTARLQRQYVDLEERTMARVFSLEQHLENKSQKAEALQQELGSATAREIASRRAVDLNEANITAERSQMEATVAQFRRTASVESESWAAKERIWQTRLEAAKACEAEVRQAMDTSRAETEQMCQQSAAALKEAQSKEIKIAETAAMSDASSHRENQQLEANLARAQQSLVTVEAAARVRQQESDARFAGAQSRDEEMRKAEIALQQAHLAVEQELQMQSHAAKRASEQAEKQFADQCQTLENKMKEAHVASQRKLGMQQIEARQEMEKAEETLIARCQRLQTEVEEERASGMEKLQAHRLEAARVASSANITLSTRTQSLEAQTERAVTLLRRQEVLMDEELQEESEVAKNEIAAIESTLYTKIRYAEEASQSAEQAVTRMENMMSARNSTLKAQLEASQNEFAQAKRQVAEEASAAVAERRVLEQQIVSSEMASINVKHEFVCEQAALQARQRHLESALGHAQQSSERAESGAVVRYRDLENLWKAFQQQETTAMSCCKESEAMMAERCAELEAQTQSRHLVEIQAERSEAATAAAAVADRRGLEAMLEQLRWTTGRQESASNAKIESLGAELQMSNAEVTALQAKLEAQEERFRAARPYRAIRKPDGDGSLRNVARLAKAKPLVPPEPARDLRPVFGNKRDSPEAGGG